MSGGNDTEQNTAEEHIAVVKWYSPDKNFGFAKLVETDKDVFIHKNAIVGNSEKDSTFWNRCLFKGEQISLTLKKDENGRVTGENIKSAVKDNDGNTEPLLFASSNMIAYINKFKERWERRFLNNDEWKVATKKNN